MGDIGLFNKEQPSPAEKKDSEQKETPLSSGRPYSFQMSTQDPRRNVVGGSEVEYTIDILNTGSKSDTMSIKSNILFSAKLGDEAPEWMVKIEGVDKDEDTGEYQIRVTPGTKGSFFVKVSVPHGVRYGDKVDIILTGTSMGDTLISETLSLTTATKQTFFAVKTQLGQEKDVVDAIGKCSSRSEISVFAVLSPAKLRGYVFVEAMNKDRLKDVVRGIKKARGVVDADQDLTFEEILPYLTPKPLVSGIKKGDIVELVAGPFKGEKARVQQIDESKEEITVELFEAMVPIPVTIRGDSVRVLEKEGDA
ncbi:MAG: transcription elongation factor Spt5 [Candidatus Thermoplasmatota archaeon]|nr:transcription elongation factor Spt5 [Candidatus Thermoplasmatota archaeon]